MLRIYWLADDFSVVETLMKVEVKRDMIW